MTSNKNEFEQFLNEIYTDEYSLEDAEIAFMNLGNAKTLKKHYNNKTLGSLLRRENKKLFDELYKSNK